MKHLSNEPALSKTRPDPEADGPNYERIGPGPDVPNYRTSWGHFADQYMQARYGSDKQRRKHHSAKDEHSVTPTQS